MSELGNPLREPHFDHLGIRLTEWEPDRAVFELVVEPRHLNFAGSVHGGVIATLLDVACGYSGLRSIPDETAGLATVMLTTSYHAGSGLGTLTASGWVTGGGRSIFFASAEVREADGVLVASGQGAFKRARPKA